MKKKLLLFFYLFIAISITACGVGKLKRSQYLSPFDFGWSQARTGAERYNVLYRTHTAALSQGKYVNYKGIKSIELDIPKGAKSIPLTEQTDFKGAVITVFNNSKDLFLFEYRGETTAVSITSQEVDSRHYSSLFLRQGLYLLCIEDENPWVLNREGFSYGATRKDIVLIEDGIGKDEPCSPYSTKSSKPKYTYRIVTPTEKSFSNVTLKRLPGSTKMTKLVKFSYENNVRIENISITTPAGSLYGDQAICVYDCTNVILKDISINGSYSTTEMFGYGIAMNNVWNVTCKKIKAVTPWGVFGTNNTHKAYLEDCDVNRFDVHCYGKDIFCKNCVFNGVGGAYSSVFGTITYDHCIFNGACPYINRPDYNAYVSFNIVLKDCTLTPSDIQFFIVNLRAWNNKINEREELKRKCFPNVYIENLTVNIPKGCEAIELFKLPHQLTYPLPAAGISEITIKNMVFKYDNTDQVASFRVSSTEAVIEDKLKCHLSGINLLPESKKSFSQRSKKYDYSGSIVINLNSKKGEDIQISNSRINYNVTSNSQYDIAFNNCSIGCLRQSLTNNKNRRIYNDCSFYLNGCDNDKYVIDNYADYNNCKFFAASEEMEMVIPRGGKVRFKNSTVSSRLKVQGVTPTNRVEGLAIPDMLNK